MLIINDNQINEFKAAALKNFEEVMVGHVKAFFPNHFKSMKEENIRNTIRYGYSRAKSHGFTTERNVCLYLNNMLVLGSNFDTDPLYPWTYKILHENNIQDSKSRIDHLSDTMEKIFGRIRGARYADINKALLYVHQNADSLYRRVMESDLDDALSIFNDIYPKKFEVVGAPDLKRLTRLGETKAAEYGITVEWCVLAYVIFMFMIGSGFDKDPQFPWAAESLNNPSITRQEDKINKMYRKCLEDLRTFLSQYVH